LNSETEIINGCLKGQREFQKLLYERYAGKMLYVCLRYTKNKDEAQDVLQEAFIKIFGHLDKFKFEGSFEGWVRKIVVNCSLEFLRNKKRTLVFEDVEAANNLTEGDNNIIGNINAKELTELIMKLPDGYRLVFNLFVLEGYGHKEISEMLHITEGTSKSQLSKARMHLQKSVHNLLGVNITNYHHE
jgi:RNA polymerase sigma factor (sigma-70 family)